MAEKGPFKSSEANQFLDEVSSTLERRRGLLRWPNEVNEFIRDYQSLPKRWRRRYNVFYTGSTITTGIVLAYLFHAC